MPTPNIADVNNRVSDAIRRMRAAQSPASPGGTTVTPAEEQQVIAPINDAITQDGKRRFRDAFYALRSIPNALQNGGAIINTYLEERVPQILVDDSIATGRTGTIADPPVMNDDVGSVIYAEIGGAILDAPIDGDQVMQGQIGDCYFAAAISEVAEKEPQAIDDLTTINYDSAGKAVSLSVGFFRDGPSGPERIDPPITVDFDLPTRFGGLRYLHSRDRRQILLPLVEKAYAEFKGGSFEHIGNGGRGGEVMFALTGKYSKSIYVSPTMDPQVLYRQLEAAMANGGLGTAATYGHSSTVKYDGTGVYGNHLYSIWNLAQKNGEGWVQLRNPWGNVEWRGEGRDATDDGVFWMKVTDFQKYFSGVDVSKAGNPRSYTGFFGRAARSATDRLKLPPALEARVSRAVHRTARVAEWFEARA